MYKSISAFSLFVRIVILPNPFENYEHPFLVNLLAEPLIQFMMIPLTQKSLPIRTNVKEKALIDCYPAALQLERLPILS